MFNVDDLFTPANLDNHCINLYRDYTVRYYRDNKIVTPNKKVLETFIYLISNNIVMMSPSQ